jgi:sec-independent protein translocase protein TatA
MGSLGAWEIGVIALVIVILFGTRKLPELGSGLGKAISNFKRSYREGSEIDVTPRADDQKPKDESK